MNQRIQRAKGEVVGDLTLRIKLEPRESEKLEELVLENRVALDVKGKNERELSAMLEFRMRWIQVQDLPGAGEAVEIRLLHTIVISTGFGELQLCNT